jgi:hypothetical protein
MLNEPSLNTEQAYTDGLSTSHKPSKPFAIRNLGLSDNSIHKLLINLYVNNYRPKGEKQCNWYYAPPKGQ